MPAKLKKVHSINELVNLAYESEPHKQWLFRSARNLGGENIKDIDSAKRWLDINAMETNSEEGVVDEINGVKDL